MTFKELHKIDFRILICSALLGLALTVCTGRGEFTFGIFGIGIVVSVIYKLKNISRLTKGNTLEEMTKSFMIYIFIPIQICMAFALLGSLIYNTFF